MRKSDFSRVRRALRLQGEPDYVPLFDNVNGQVKKAFMGKPVTNFKEEVEFAVAAGYDFISLTIGLRSYLRKSALIGEEGGHSSKTSTVFRVQRSHYSVYTDEEGDRTWANEGSGNITSLKEFEEFPWRDFGIFDFSNLEKIKQFLPPEMKVIAGVDGFYTPVWQLMGQEVFYLALLQNPELIARMFEKVGSIQLAVAEKLTSFDHVGALRISDDIAYNARTLVSPKHLRTYFFPWLKKLADLCKSRNLPLIYHSDGNLADVLEDIIAAGVNGLHPIQPSAMDIRDTKKTVAGRLCLLGNIDLDVMARGTEAEVRELVMRNLREVAPGGGYLLGSSNSIPEFIPLKNYNAMRETALKYGKYPISL